MKYADDLSFLKSLAVGSRAELIENLRMESANDYLWVAMFRLRNAGQCFTVILIAILLFIIVLNGKSNKILNLPYMKKLELKTLNIFRIFSAFQDSINEIS